MDKNIIQEKTYAFAVKLIPIVRDLQESKKEYVLTKQIMRSGTAIGALVEESIGGQSKKDFYHKMSIAYKEARETKYWIKLMKDTNLIQLIVAEDLLKLIEEIIKIIGAIQRTTRNNLSVQKT